MAVDTCNIYEDICVIYHVESEGCVEFRWVLNASCVSMCNIESAFIGSHVDNLNSEGEIPVLSLDLRLN